MMVKEYEQKVVKSVIWKEIRKFQSPGFQWMKKNVTPDQVARVLRVQEQTVPTKFLSRIRGKETGDRLCRLCRKQDEGIKHWLCSCEYLARKEYLKRHDQTLKVLYAEVLKQHGMEKETNSVVQRESRSCEGEREGTCDLEYADTYTYKGRTKTRMENRRSSADRGGHRSLKQLKGGSGEVVPRRMASEKMCGGYAEDHRIGQPPDDSSHRMWTDLIP